MRVMLAALRTLDASGATVSQVYLKSLDCQQLRSQIVMRHNLVKLRVMAEGSIRSRLALYGRRMKSHRTAKKVRAEVEGHLSALKNQEGVDLGPDILPLLSVSESLRTYLTELDNKLTRRAEDHPVCRHLMTVTGIGAISALSFYSAIETPDRFRRASDVAAYLGLVPRRHQSGEVSYTRGITKTGSKLTRAHLVNAALVFHRRGPESELRAWASALQERVGRKRARIALARKLAVVLLTMWKLNVPFDPFPSRATGVS